jgi:hypothetical protein
MLCLQEPKAESPVVLASGCKPPSRTRLRPTGPETVWASHLSNRSAGDQRHARQMSGSPNMPKNRYQTRPSSASYNRPTRSGQCSVSVHGPLCTATHAENGAACLPSINCLFYKLPYAFSPIPFSSYILSNDSRGRHLTSSPTNNMRTQPIVSRLLYTVYTNTSHICMYRTDCSLVRDLLNNFGKVLLLDNSLLW